MDKYEEFLKADFEQSHEWMRHYDSAFTSMANFFYTGFVAILTASYVLYSGFPASIEASVGVTILLVFGTLLSPVFLFWFIRNRFNFTKVARWINEIRGSYLKQAPLEIKNKSEMYTNAKHPPYYNPGSTHSIFLYFTALCGSILITITFASAIRTIALYHQRAYIYPFCSLTLIGFSTFIAYMLWIILYLSGKEKEAKK